jgi:hypothetical protein
MYYVNTNMYLLVLLSHCAVGNNYYVYLYTYLCTGNSIHDLIAYVTDIYLPTVPLPWMNY